MSTKTAFKRIALVAAAALAIGGISAVSAQAVGPDFGVTVSYGTPNVATTAETATQIAGVANFVTLVATPALYFTVTGGTTTTGTTSGTLVAGGTVSIATPTVGTITVTSYDIVSGAASTTSTSTVTITVTASVPGTVFAAATVLGSASTLVGTSGTSAAITPASDAIFAVTAPAGSTNVANFSVTEADAAGVTLSPGFYKPITATVTNGLLTASGAGTLGTILPGQTTYLVGIPTGAVNFSLSSIAGLAGTSTVTISVNGVVAKTYTATFTGAAAKIVATVINPVIGVGTAAAIAPVLVGGVFGTGITANTLAVKVQEFDANGNALTVPALTLTPVSAATVSASVVLGSGTFADGSMASATAVGLNLTGVAAGTTMVTVTDGTLVSAPVSIRVSSGVPTSVVYTTDAAGYPAGGAGKLTVTVSDVVGTVPAGTYTLATGAAISSLAFTGNNPTNLGATVTLNDMGAVTAAFNAPLSDGSVTVGGTSTATVTVTPAVFTVASAASDAANAAVDAANEATDAANAATDAANAAADSADAATQAAQDAGDKADAALAAVTALSQQVTTVLAKVAALSVALSKIIKALAKVSKKVHA